jgi:glycine hydroxymethyltransferase
MTKKFRILFVCTGNICRSPLAEGYLRYLCEINKYSDIETDSAGISALRGTPPSKEAVIVAEDWGFDISKLKSRQFAKNDLINFDLVLTMTDEQRKWIINNFPATESKIKLLREFSVNGGRADDISDPIGMSMDSYNVIFYFIKKSIEGLIRHLEIERALISRDK